MSSTPEAVAQRIDRYAKPLLPREHRGRRRLRFSIHVGMGGVDPDVTYANLKATVDGARFASKKYRPTVA